MTALPIAIGFGGFITGYITSNYLNNSVNTIIKKENDKIKHKQLNIVLSDDICGFSKITLKKTKNRRKKKNIKKNLLDDLKEKLKERRRIIILD